MARHLTKAETKMHANASVIQAMRPAFLVLTPVCVLLAVAIATFQQQSISWLHSLLCLIGALAAHISVNTLNEYQDFHSGLDLKTQRTAFSGGSGLLPNNPQLTQQVKFASILSLAVTIAIGCYFISVYGRQILLLGLLGIVIIITYTQWINKLALICLIAPGLGFGLLMVAGSYFCITGVFSSDMWLISLIPFCLINNLLLLNQIPDSQADKSVGRNHLPIKYGMQITSGCYIAFALTAQLLIIYGYLADYLPLISLLTLLPMLLSYVAFFGLATLQENIASQAKFLAANVACAVLSPLVLSITLLL